MIRSLFIAAALVGCIICTSCNRNKPKAVSKDVTKTSVLVNGKKDSVINNPDKNYGNATVAEPCVKCMIQVIQSDSNYKQRLTGKPASTINYVVNWAPSKTRDTTNKKGGTNRINVDVVEKDGNKQKLLTYIYDNSLSKLYYIDYAQNNKRKEVETDPVALKRIRNSCYWGVASGK